MKTTAIVGAAVVVLAALLKPRLRRLAVEAANRPAPIVDGRAVITHSTMTKVVMVILHVGSAVAAVWFAVLFAGSSLIVWAFAGPVVALLVVASAFAFAELRLRFELDEAGMRYRTKWRGWRELAWQDLRSVRYLQSKAAFELVGRDGERVRVQRWLVGHRALVDALGALPELADDALWEYGERRQSD